MDLRLSEDQTLLQATLRRFLADQPHASAADLASLGILAAFIPAGYGGMELGPIEAMVIAEEFGRALHTGPALESALTAASIVAGLGSAPQQARWLPAIASGEMAAAVAWSEPMARDPLAPSVTVRRDGEAVVINGTKAPVSLVEEVGLILVIAGEVDAVRVVALERADAPVAASYETIDDLPAVSLAFRETRVPGSALLGERAESADVLADIFDRAVAAQAAELTGIMATLLNATRDQLRTRTQFGASLGSFQALQHRFADMYIAYEQARSATIRASLACLQSPSGERRRAVSAAKVLAAGSAQLVGHETIQMFGAMGMTEEAIVGPAVKRIRALEPRLGTPAFHCARYADSRKGPGS